MPTVLSRGLSMPRKKDTDRLAQIGRDVMRHQAGKIYLRGKENGKAIRFTPETSELRISKLKRYEMLAGIRAAAETQQSSGLKRTIVEIVPVVSIRLLNQPQLDPKTVYLLLR